MSDITCIISAIIALIATFISFRTCKVAERACAVAERTCNVAEEQFSFSKDQLYHKTKPKLRIYDNCLVFEVKRSPDENITFIPQYVIINEIKYNMNYDETYPISTFKNILQDLNGQCIPFKPRDKGQFVYSVNSQVFSVEFSA